MFQKFTTNQQIINDYNDYIFIKMNYEMYMEELEYLVFQYSKNKGLIEFYKLVKNDEFMITALDLLSELIEELSIDELKIIISIFNPVIYDNIKRIYNNNQLENEFNSKLPIFDKRIVKKLKNNIKNSF